MSALDNLSERARSRLRKRAQPQWVSPMLATLTAARFSDPAWLFERKLDGIRCLAFRRGGRVLLLSRNRQNLDASYPEVVEVLEKQGAKGFILDGEIVALSRGVSSFERLQGRSGIKDPVAARNSGIAVHYFAFDVLYLEGHDTTGLELRDRKRLLRKALIFGGALRFATHRLRRGEDLYREACEKGLEGIIAKRARSEYSGGRSDDWLKMKCENQQELVVGGWTEPKGAREALGALLLGTYEGDELVYAGKVGTGFDTRTLRMLLGRLEPLERKTVPFRGTSLTGLPRQGVHWAEPELVAQIAFSEWTEDGKLRHPRYLGLREDKPARSVVRERPEG